MEIQRLNMDSSWWFSWEDNTWLIDPWLIGSEIDGFKWLNEQWHATPSVLPEDLPNYGFVIVSQSYEDHCHPQTLQELSENKPMLATPKAFKKLKKYFPKRQVLEIPQLSSTPPLSFQNLYFYSLLAKKTAGPDLLWIIGV